MGEPADPRDRLQERIEFLEAMDELRKLPESMQRVVLVRSQVHKQQDVADILGISRSRVNHLLATVSLRVNDLAEQRNTPRAAGGIASRRTPARARGRAARVASSRRSAGRSRATAATVRRSWRGAERPSRSTTTAASTAGLRRTRRSARDQRTCLPVARMIELTEQRHKSAKNVLVLGERSENSEGGTIDSPSRLLGGRWPDNLRDTQRRASLEQLGLRRVPEHRALRLAGDAGRNPYDRVLQNLIGELSTRISEVRGQSTRVVLVLSRCSARSVGDPSSAVASRSVRPGSARSSAASKKRSRSPATR